MTIARPDERLTHTNTVNRHSQTQPKKTAWATGISRLPMLVLVLSLAKAAHATPVTGQDSAFEKREEGHQDMSPKVWVPILVAILVLVFILFSVRTKNSLFRKMVGLFGFAASSPAGAPVNATNGSGARELTAEQLAGTINGDAAAQGTGPRRARRPRRTRRTPSQASVTSLPAYNKEPGEEELVIFRGRDMEDATMPAAMVMNSLDEEREEESRYSPMPTSPNNQPLLRSEDPSAGDLSLQNLRPDERDITRRSFDTGSHETSSLMRVESNLPENTLDPRGEAPAYFEVVDAENQTHLPATASLVSPPASLVSPPASPEANVNNRRSGFRTLLNRMSIHGGHQRGDSSNSAMSSTLSHGPESSRHRPSQSGSGSLLSNSMFRTISRQKSTHTLNSMRLTSPSLISLNSISPPLTHTLVRTEFTYPKSGPTPEQLKVISSRETFARFGVPYGPDAIAYAASTSRHDLLPPPPDFEATEGSGSELQPPRSASAAGPSRLRSSSNVADLQAQAEVEAVNRERSAATSPSPAPLNPTVEPSAAGDVGRSSSISKAHGSISGPSTSVQTQENTSESAPSTPFTRPPVSEFGKLSAPPPSAYHESSSGPGYMRSESAASMYSYATAAESLTPSTRSFMDSDEPSTPRLQGSGGQHVLESTDATVMPSTNR